jgi:hypothetical protein
VGRGGSWAANEYLPRADAAAVQQLRRNWDSGAWQHLMRELETLQSSRCDECVPVFPPPTTS